MSEDYVAVYVSLVARSADAVMVAQGRHQVWIPRSLIHGADEAGLNELDLGDEFRLRLFRWKAEQAGLVEANAGQKELFG